MKTVTCKQLGGACDQEFSAETFEEIAKMSKDHGMEMFHKGDEAHIEAMKKMASLMKNSEDMQNWMEEKRKLFDSL